MQDIKTLKANVKQQKLHVNVKYLIFGAKRYTDQNIVAPIFNLPLFLFLKAIHHLNIELLHQLFIKGAALKTFCVTVHYRFVRNKIYILPFTEHMDQTPVYTVEK